MKKDVLRILSVLLVILMIGSSVVVPTSAVTAGIDNIVTEKPSGVTVSVQNDSEYPWVEEEANGITYIRSSNSDAGKDTAEFNGTTSTITYTIDCSKSCVMYYKVVVACCYYDCLEISFNGTVINTGYYENAAFKAYAPLPELLDSLVEQSLKLNSGVNTLSFSYKNSDHARASISYADAAVLSDIRIREAGTQTMKVNFPSDVSAEYSINDSEFTSLTSGVGITVESLDRITIQASATEGKIVEGLYNADSDELLTKNSKYSFTVGYSDINIYIKSKEFSLDPNLEVKGYGDYPFALNGAEWVSTNKGKGSSLSILAVTAVASGKLSFEYSVSSEETWDGMYYQLDTVPTKAFTTVITDSTQRAALSGVVKWTSVSEVEMTAGQTFYIAYGKDISGNKNDDAVYIRNLCLEVTGAAVSRKKITVNYDEALGSVFLNDSAVKSGAYVNVNEGSSVSLKAENKELGEFAGWYDGSTLLSSSATYTFNASEDIAITAKYNKLNASTCKVYFDSTKGTVKDCTGTSYNRLSSGDAVTYATGKRLSLWAVPDTGYDFDGWYNGDTRVSTNTSYYFTLSEDITLTARFVRTVTVTVNFDKAEISKVSYGTTTGSTKTSKDSFSFSVNEGSYARVEVSESGIVTPCVFDGIYENGTNKTTKYDSNRVGGKYEFYPTSDVTLEVRAFSYPWSDISGYEIGRGISSVRTRSNYPWTVQTDGTLKSGELPINYKVSPLCVAVSGTGVLYLEYKTVSDSKETMLLYRKGTEICGELYSSFYGNSYLNADNYNKGDCPLFYGNNDWTVLTIPVTSGEEVYFGYLREYCQGSPYAMIRNMKVVTGTANVSVESSNDGFGTVSGRAGVVAIGDSVTLTATPKAGYRFYGWQVNGKTISLDSTITKTVTEDVAYTALFNPADYYVAHCGMTYYTDLNDAFANGGTVVLDKDIAISDNLTVPSNVTFVLPCMDTDEGNDTRRGGALTNEPPVARDKNGTPSKYRTLTISSGKKLTVSGKLVVNAEIGGEGTSEYLQNIRGGYGKIVNNGSIEISDGGAIDCFGKIDGDGSVIVNSGATLTDLYVIENWRGGTQAKVMYENGVYPMNEYSENNITCPVSINYGAKYNGFVRMYNSKTGFETTRFPQVNITNGLIRLSEGAVAVKTVYSSGSQTRERYTINGSASFAGSSLSIAGTTLSTENYIYPINGTYDFVLKNGTFTFAANYKFLPGSYVDAQSNANIIVNGGKKVVFYDKFNDVQNTGNTTYPTNRDSAYVKLSDTSLLTVNGAFAGKVISPRIDGIVKKGNSSSLSVSTKEANGYNNGTVTLSFAFAPSVFTGYTGSWVSNSYVWTLNDITVSFDTNGGDRIPPMTAKYGTSPSLPTPTKTGYDFSGWYLSDGTKWTSSDTVTSAITLFAKWLPSANTSYNVVHHFEKLTDGEYSKEIQTLKGTTDSQTQASAMNKDGFTVKNFEQKIIAPDGNTVVDIYYSRNTYTLSWDANGGSITSSGHTNGTVKYGAQIVKPGNDPTRTGYTFEGWQNIYQTMPAKDVTVKAVWKANDYTITFNSNGGTECEPIIVKYDGVFGSLPTPTRTGYVFDGWYLGNTRIEETANVTISEDKVVTAKWNAKTYTVFFDSNGGTICNEIAATFGKPYGTLPTSTREGFNFAGWYDGNTRVYDTTEYSTDGNVTLVAKWSVNEYKIVYFVDGENLVIEDNREYGASLENLYIFKKTGYKVSPWTQLDGSAVPSTMPANTICLYATTSPIEYTITYKGIDNITDPQSYTIETDTFSLTQPTKEGHTFLGWTRDEDPTLLDSVSVEKGSVGNIVFTAKWKANEYSLSYRIDEVTVSSESVAYGSLVSVKPDETKIGYTFSGWKSSDVAFESGTFIMPANDVVIEGSFSANTYTVSFDANGGEGVMERQNFSYDEAQKLNSNAFVRTGYTFSGWKNGSLEYTDGQNVSNLSAANGDEITLTAQWKINSYTISFESNGGTPVDPINADYGSVIEPPSNPMRDGYRFAGWSEKIPSTMPADNMTIKANWESYLDLIEAMDSFEGDNLTAAREYYTHLTDDQKYNSGSKKLYELIKTIRATAISELKADIEAAVLPTNNILIDENGPIAVISVSNENDVSIMLSQSDYLAANMQNINFLSELFGHEEVKGIIIGSQKETEVNQMKLMLAVANEVGISISDASTATVSLLDGEQFSARINAKTAEGISYAITYEIEFFNQYHKLTWDANNGTISGEYTVGDVAFGTTIVEPVVTREGYKFKGWDKKVVETMGKTDVSYVAEWAINSYTVSFDSAGGESVDSITEEFGGKITLPTSSKEGYDFGGWYLPNGTEWTKDSTVPAKDVVLKAKWIPRDDTPYTVVHHFETLNDNEYITESQNDLFGTTDSETKAVSMTKEGFSVKAFDQKSISGDGRTVVNIYYQRDSYVVTWNENGGSFATPGSIANTVKFGESIVKPDSPIRDGFDFVSWIGFTDDMTMPAHDVTFEAEWIEHSFSNYVSNNDATCEKDGTKTSKCDRCDLTNTIIDKDSKLGHNWDSGKITLSPTCTESGERTFTCSRCKSTKVEKVEKLNHNYGDFAFDGAASKTHSKICLNDESHRIVEACVFDIVTVSVQPTCTELGVRTYTCSVCGGSYCESIDMIAHTNVSDSAVEPSCEETGLSEGSHCSVCGTVIVPQTVIEATGHSFTSYVYNNDATCIEKGTKTSICDICGKSDTIVDSDAVGSHVPGSIVIENEVESTCTSPGSYDEVVYCTLCNEELTRTTKSTEIVEHTAGEESVENEVLPTCTESGSYESVVYCSACGCELSRKTVLVEATGHSFVSKSEKNGTSFTCSDCGYSYLVRCPICAKIESCEDNNIKILYRLIDLVYHFISFVLMHQ